MTKMMRQRFTKMTMTPVMVLALSAAATAQAVAQRTSTPATATSKMATPSTPPPSYIIGPDDVLAINVWQAKDVSGDVIVRPDGKITLSVGNDIVASGLTTEELKAKVTDELKKFYEQPDVFIQVKQVNSRRVFITGSVGKAGPYPLTGPMTIVQLISMAGGLQEFADAKNIMVISGTLKGADGQPLTYKVNYDELLKGKNVAKNNIELRPGDTVMVK
jgi:polysaccharide biosynthesis/export protein